MYNRLLTQNVSGSPRVSVIVPTYNTARFIGAALDSVFAQAYPNYEVIVVNDGSPDTPELERVLERFTGRISYIKKENGGVSSARNAGIRASTGDLIATLDSDDLWEPNWMSVQVEFLQQNPDVDLVYGNGIIFGDSHPDVLLMDMSPSEGEVTFEALVMERCCVPTSGMLVRREAVFGAGLFDENLRWGEDFDLWLRIAKAGYRIAYHRNVILRYRRHAGGVSHHPSTLTRYASTVLEKMLRDFDLTPEERRIAQEKREYFDARVLLFDGQIALDNRDFTTAADKLSRANATLRQRRLALTIAAVRICPRLVWYARRLKSGRNVAIH
jgi:glycosyltransferase involved in cell wall biosynthesis